MSIGVKETGILCYVKKLYSPGAIIGTRGATPIKFPQNKAIIVLSIRM